VPEPGARPRLQQQPVAYPRPSTGSVSSVTGAGQPGLTGAFTRRVADSRGF
jgi:hypothetical protein